MFFATAATVSALGSITAFGVNAHTQGGVAPDRGGHFTWGKHRSEGRFCSHDGLGMRIAKLYLDAELDMNAAQKESWRKVEAAYEAVKPEMEKLCNIDRTYADPASLSAQLAAFETAMTQSAEISANLRPALAEWENSLTETQREKLRQLMSRRRH